jgi:hypothetical protein
MIEKKVTLSGFSLYVAALLQELQQEPTYSSPNKSFSTIARQMG